MPSPIEAKRTNATNILTAMLKELSYYRKGKKDPFFKYLYKRINNYDMHAFNQLPVESLYPRHIIAYRTLTRADTEYSEKQRIKLRAFLFLFNHLFTTLYISSTSGLTEHTLPYDWSETPLSKIPLLNDLPFYYRVNLMEVINEKRYNRKSFLILKNYLLPLYEESREFFEFSEMGNFVNTAYSHTSMYNSMAEDRISVQEYLNRHGDNFPDTPVTQGDGDEDRDEDAVFFEEALTQLADTSEPEESPFSRWVDMEVSTTAHTADGASRMYAVSAPSARDAATVSPTRVVTHSSENPFGAEYTWIVPDDHSS